MRMLLSKYRKISGHVSANYPRFWRSRLDLPLLFSLLGGLFAFALIWIDSLVAETLTPDWQVVVDQVISTFFFGGPTLLLGAAGYWLFAVTRNLPMRTFPRFANCPLFATLVVGIGLVFAGFFVVVFSFMVVGVDAPSLRQLKLPNWQIFAVFFYTAAFIALPFKMVQMSSLRTFFIGFLWYLISVALLSGALVLVAAGLTQAASFFARYQSAGLAWLVGGLVVLLGLGLVALLHWPIAAAIASRTNTAAIKPALVSATLWIVTVVLTGAAFAIPWARSLLGQPNSMSDSDSVALLIIGVVVVEGLMWLISQIATWPER